VHPGPAVPPAGPLPAVRGGAHCCGSRPPSARGLNVLCPCHLGPGRGGAYTYDWIERRLGIDIRSTGRVIPELQHLQVGDEIPMPGYTMRVEQLDPGRAMVVRSRYHAWVWSFELRPAGKHTRLISRNRFDAAALPVKDKLAYPVVEPGS
jgi:hypothetical protein